MTDLQAEYSRETKETRIQVKIALRGSGQVQIKTGLGFADHMLTLLGFWAGFDLELTAEGDLEVDAHHTLEDTGLCLGETLSRAIGDKSGLTRVGWARVPMDEALSEVAIDISGRPYLVYHDQILPDTIFNQEKDLWREFFKSLAFRAGMNLHINFCYGRNGHHLIESACKGVGLSLRQALAPDRSGILSTKGRLD
ncbi:MAG: imidazoleglycerol-phosphate dehydratase HisB [Desulfohalobiaceae bacterium]|nr:imidazoleglycerol-phosphate dehydratase HisB [Desulfohalobiaceae bacterium]